MSDHRLGASAPVVQVVAFDGQVVDTLPLRAKALQESLLRVVGQAGGAAATDFNVTPDRVAGRDFVEAARPVLERLVREQRIGGEELETLVDLVALDAARRYSGSIAHGVSLAPGAAELLATLHRTGRVVARADSVRRDVAAILAFGALEHAFTFIRCSDDAPRLAGQSTFASSMAAISARSSTTLPGCIIRDMMHGMKYHQIPIRWTSFRGAKATDALNGLVTNDVAALAVGESQLAAALSPKGKLVCDMYIVREAADALLTGVIEHGADAWTALVRKYVNPRLCTVADESSRYRTFVLFGKDAERVGRGLREDGMPTEVLTPLPGAASAFLLLVPVGEDAEVIARLLRHGVTAATDDEWHVARVEAGLPRFGVDMDENTIPQEANLDALGAISFTKGCYTGQETVARIHFRGHVNRHLRGLTSGTLLVRGQVVVDGSGKPIGDVRSAALSPVLGPIAIVMLRREVNLGDVVRVESADGTVGEPVRATVHALPFMPGGVHPGGIQ